jgi:zinc transport system substrate-binding protein
MLIAVAMLGCDNTETPQQPATPELRTTFYPTTYFAQRIAGDLANVSCPLPANEDPITWMPDAATIAAYQQADLVVINGADFEKWVARVSLPPSKLVDTAAPLADTFVRFKTAISHSHGPSGQHDHTGVDGHTWLDPQNAKVQAAEICKALVRILPDHADKLNANHAALAANLDKIDSLLRELSIIIKKQNILAAHPAYNYLAGRYEWNVTNLDLDPETAPSDETIGSIRKQIEKLTPRPTIILWESEPSGAAADRLEKDLALKSVVVSPCEHAPGQPGDYFSVMLDNIQRLTSALAADLQVEPLERQ